VKVIILIEWRFIALTSLIVLVLVGLIAPNEFRRFIEILREIFQAIP